MPRRFRPRDAIGHAGRAAGGGAIGWLAVDPAFPAGYRLGAAGLLTIVIVTMAVCRMLGKFAEPAASVTKLLWSFRKPKPPTGGKEAP